MISANDERHIILRRINLEIREHSSFFNYWRRSILIKWFKFNLWCLKTLIGLINWRRNLENPTWSSEIKIQVGFFIFLR